MIAEAIGIAGSGRVARVLGRLLAAGGASVVCVASRNPEHARAAASSIGAGVEAVPYDDLGTRAGRLLVAVSDAAVPVVAARIAAAGRSRIAVALHTCGSAGPEALAPLRSLGVHCGALHPLTTIPDSGADLEGISFGVWGDECAVEWAAEIAGRAHGTVLRIHASAAPLYHAAAVMASNYVVALLAAAQFVLEEARLARDDALAALGPLVRAAVGNALAKGPVAALTGPIERGDVLTVAEHLRGLAALPESVRNLYRSAGLQTVAVARQRGLAPETAAALESILKAG